MVVGYCDEEKFIVDVYSHFGRDVFQKFILGLGNRRSLRGSKVGHVLIMAYLQTNSARDAAKLKKLLYQHGSLVKEYKERMPF